MPCYGSTETLRIIRQAFEYVFVPTQIGGGKPSLELIPVDGRFKAAGVDVVPVPVLHGRMRVLGFRIGSFAYVTDCSAIPPSSMELLRSLDVLVVGAIRHEPHETHFSISEGLAVIQELRPTQAFITHITHRLDHQKTNESLPPGVELAYDGLNVEIHDCNSGRPQRSHRNNPAHQEVTNGRIYTQDGYMSWRIGPPVSRDEVAAWIKIWM